MLHHIRSRETIRMSPGLSALFFLVNHFAPHKASRLFALLYFTIRLRKPDERIMQSSLRLGFLSS